MSRKMVAAGLAGGLLLALSVIAVAGAPLASTGVFGSTLPVYLYTTNGTGYWIGQSGVPTHAPANESYDYASIYFNSHLRAVISQSYSNTPGLGLLSLVPLAVGVALAGFFYWDWSRRNALTNPLKDESPD